MLRGTLDIGKDLMVDSMRNVDSCRQLLLYGNGGIWLTDSKASYFKDFNEGLPEGADALLREEQATHRRSPDDTPHQHCYLHGNQHNAQADTKPFMLFSPSSFLH